MSKKIKSYNLSKEVIKAITEKAGADGRKDSDWLDRFLTTQLVGVKVKSVKTALANPETKFNFKNELLYLGVNKEALDDWLSVRVKKKASNTKTALKLVLNEIAKTHLTVNDAITHAAGANWSGFKAQWYTNSIQDANKDILKASSASDWHLKEDTGF